jgi:hypothetical protein
MRSRRIEPRKTGLSLCIGKARTIVQGLIHLVSGIGVGKGDHIITSGMELQNLSPLVNVIEAEEERSLIQDTEKAGVEVRIVILLVIPNVRENARRKDIAELTHLILILVIMNTWKDINLVVDDHLTKTEAESILYTTSTDEKIMLIIHEWELLEYDCTNEGRCSEQPLVLQTMESF